jgi:tRNA dimethylallyltransferase
MKKDKIIVIVGPNASGKSDISIQIAKKFKCEIISADSRQVYKNMDIGTGKVTKKEQKVAKHHLLDVASPKRVFTVDDYKKLAKKALVSIRKKHKTPIIIGGTGFYIDALVYDLAIPHVPPDKKLRSKLEKQTTEKLFLKLKKLDPGRADSIDAKNKQRLIRALEILKHTSSPIPVVDTKYFKSQPKYSVLWIGKTWPKKVLDRRIKIRLEKRFKQGMISEIKKLHEKGVSYRRLESFGLEYKWVAMYLQGKISKENMEKSLLTAISQYARRQMTWFKRNKNIHWIKNDAQATKLVKEFLE